MGSFLSDEQRKVFNEVVMGVNNLDEYQILLVCNNNIELFTIEKFRHLSLDKYLYIIHNLPDAKNEQMDRIELINKLMGLVFNNRIKIYSHEFIPKKMKV